MRLTSTSGLAVGRQQIAELQAVALLGLVPKLEMSRGQKALRAFLRGLDGGVDYLQKMDAFLNLDLGVSFGAR